MVLLHSKHMSQPSQASVCYFLGDAPAPCFFVQFIVGDLIRPKDLTYSSEASIVEHFHFPGVRFYHSPARRTIQQNRFYIAVVKEHLGFKAVLL